MSWNVCGALNMTEQAGGDSDSTSDRENADFFFYFSNILDDSVPGES